MNLIAKNENETLLQVTDKVYVQLIDATGGWVKTNACRLGDNEYYILPDYVFDENDPTQLCEFIPGDIVALDKYTFSDGTTGLVCTHLIKPSIRPDKKYFEFLFKAAVGHLEINNKTLSIYRQEIGKIKEQQIAGQYFYPAILRTVEKLERSSI